MFPPIRRAACAGMVAVALAASGARAQQPADMSAYADTSGFYAASIDVSAPQPAARAQYINVSLDGLFSGGTSTASDGEIPVLQGGGHDPSHRGFTVQNVEVSLTGAVDPYLAGEAHIVFGLDFVELEEAFLQTTSLPGGFQLEAGHFFTEFGRINPRHPHQWHWLDLPVINARIFGPDGMRGPGFRLGWLAPLPVFTEIHLGMQDARGETMASFLGEDAAATGIADRSLAGKSVNGLDDVAWLGRWTSFLDLGPSVGVNVGASGMIGPNASGADGRTVLYGADLLVRWRPVTNFRGWPYASVQAEVIGRDWRAAEIGGLPERTFADRGGYVEVLYGFRYGWSAGVRGEYATGSGDYAGYAREDDPLRADRWRFSPLVIWSPTEFSRFRFEYTYDRAPALSETTYHSAWLGFEFGIGAHPAHAY